MEENIEKKENKEGTEDNAEEIKEKKVIKRKIWMYSWFLRRKNMISKNSAPLKESLSSFHQKPR
jgi:hypothetical protein